MPTRSHKNGDLMWFGGWFILGFTTEFPFFSAFFVAGQMLPQWRLQHVFHLLNTDAHIFEAETLVYQGMVPLIGVQNPKQIYKYSICPIDSPSSGFPIKIIRNNLQQIQGTSSISSGFARRKKLPQGVSATLRARGKSPGRPHGLPKIYRDGYLWARPGAGTTYRAAPCGLALEEIWDVDSKERKFFFVHDRQTNRTKFIVHLHVLAVSMEHARW